MLTPTDIHLIVGSFCKLTTPESVDIVLGEMVYDKASKRKRDIDIGIKYFDSSGEEVLFAGLQVKDHGRKLGSPEVEQLCLHFKDSDSIKRGGIVSSSGFTTPGINKAKYHGIELYEFRDYDPHLELNHFRFSPGVFITEVVRQFIGLPQITYLLKSKDRDSIGNIRIEPELSILDSNCQPLLGLTVLDDLSKSIMSNVLNYKEVANLLDNAENDQEVPLNIIIPIEDILLVDIENNHHVLGGVAISGVMCKVSNEITAKFKILTKLGKPDENVGAAICEFSNGMLACFSTSEKDRSLKLSTITLPDRLRSKIHNLKIKGAVLGS